MASRRSAGIIALGLMLVAAGAVGYALWRPRTAAPIVGIVRATEVRVAPEVGGQLAAINVQKGARVRAGEVVAELSAIELTAAVAQARAALAAAKASRDHVYAGVRAEEVAALAAEIAKAKSRLAYAELQLGRTATLARQDVASQQSLDQAQNDAASARADVAEAEANHAAAQAGPTREERAIADAQVKAAASALAVLERQLDKTILRAPADGVVSVVVAEVGENVLAGEPVLAIEVPDKRWLSFNAREDRLHGLTVGTTVDVARPGGQPPTSAVVTELKSFAAEFGKARMMRSRRSSPSCCRSGRSRPGRPSARSATTISTRCACASIRNAMPPPSSSARRCGSLADAERMRAGRAVSMLTSSQIVAAARFQKRKRNPTVGSMLLRWKKLFANPLFTCENMKPA